MDILIGILEQGLIYGILALGLYITYSILDFPDLTVDGSFPLGSAVAAVAVVNGLPPVPALLLASLAGVLAGCITGFIHVKLKVRDLLSGIIVMTGLYTINIGIAGKANLAIGNAPTIFNYPLLEALPPAAAPYRALLVLVPLVLLLKVLLDLYLKTRSGFLLKAAGDNSTLVKTMAKDPGNTKILGLAIANGLVALAGGVLAMQQRFFELSLGAGSMVLGLASVIIGLKLCGRISFIKATTAVLIGSIVYKGAVALALSLGLSPNSMKLITAVLFLLILLVNREDGRKKVNRVRN